jgi:chemotaxis methyl-accepting protein methylase
MSSHYGAPDYGTSVDPQNPKLRHIVFVDRTGGRKRALDLRPMPAKDAGRATAREVSTAAAPADPDEPPQHEPFIEWLFARAGLEARSYGTQTLARRLPACLRMLRAADPAIARDVLERHPSLVPSAVSALVIGVTSFFRDAAVFGALRDRVLPTLAAERAGVRIWSAGCSDGQELYSVAVLAAELDLLRRVELLGTDCRSDAIARARAASYDVTGIRGVAPDLLNRYFMREPAGQWRVADTVRRATQWRTGDVLARPEPGQWDLILCRNMAMYLWPDAAARLWQALEGLLRPGGILVLGKAERPLGERRLTMVAPCIYRREWA